MNRQWQCCGSGLLAKLLLIIAAGTVQAQEAPVFTPRLGVSYTTDGAVNCESSLTRIKLMMSILMQFDCFPVKIP